MLAHERNKASTNKGTQILEANVLKTSVISCLKPNRFQPGLKFPKNYLHVVLILLSIVTNPLSARVPSSDLYSKHRINPCFSVRRLNRAPLLEIFLAHVTLLLSLDRRR